MARKPTPPDDDKKSWGLRVHCPAESPHRPVNYASARYFSPDGEIDWDKWGDMIKHATPEQKLAVRRMLADRGTGVFTAFEKSCHDNADHINTAIEQHVAFSNVGQHARRSAIFNHYVAKTRHILQQEASGGKVDWEVHEDPQKYHIFDPDMKPEMHHAGNAIQDLQLLLFSIHSSKNPMVEMLTAQPLLILILISELNASLVPPHPPAPGGGRREYGRGA